MEFKKDKAISWRIELNRNLQGKEYNINGDKSCNTIRASNFFLVPMHLRDDIKQLLTLTGYDPTDQKVFSVYGENDTYDIAVRLEKEDSSRSSLGSEFILVDKFISDYQIDIAPIRQAVEKHGKIQS